MKQINIIGGKTLSGTIKISGAKNSAVALIPASLLADDIVKIDNVPNISDIKALNEILEFLGAKVTLKDGLMTINPSSIKNKEIPESVSSKLRASYYFMSALLGKYKHVEMYFPGGCKIGARPIDQTLKGFAALGARIKEDNNKFIIDADELIGGHVYLDMPSVGATINTILASVRAKGVTTIENAAKEPEIVNVATFLNNMGAKIVGAGTSEIKVTGVKSLKGCFSEVIPDRIESGTYIIAGALLGDNLKIENIIPEHVEALTLKLSEMGVKFKIGRDSIIINRAENLKPIKLKTQGYPGFPTDLQQPITTLLTQCSGVSTLEETIYENRFQNVPYLNNMGANIEIHGRKIKIKGKTVINDIEHVLRGYENIIEKLSNVGAKIELEEI